MHLVCLAIDLVSGLGDLILGLEKVERGRRVKGGKKKGRKVRGLRGKEGV